MPSHIDEAGHTKAFDYPVAEHWGESQRTKRFFYHSFQLFFIFIILQFLAEYNRLVPPECDLEKNFLRAFGKHGQTILKSSRASTRSQLELQARQKASTEVDVHIKCGK